MPQALDTVSGGATAPSNTFTAWTMASGDSLTVRNSNVSADKPNLLLQAWFLNFTPAIARIRSPRLHDNVNGIRCAAGGVGTLRYGLSVDDPQVLYPQDTLIVETTGSATAGQNENGSLLIYYPDLPGVAARFLDPATMRKRTVNIVSVAVTPGAATTTTYGSSVALNSTEDLLKANTDYALLGAQCFSTANCPTTLALRGPDTGNLRVSLPLNTVGQQDASNWFIRLSTMAGIPLIPVINSANKQGTYIDALGGAGWGTAAEVDLLFAQLA